MGVSVGAVVHRELTGGGCPQAPCGDSARRGPRGSVCRTAPATSAMGGGRWSIEGVGVVAKDPVGEMLRLSAQARAAAQRVHAQRVALSRFSLVWWQGGAADAYQAAVQVRVNALVAMQAELEFLSVACHELAARYAVEAVVDSLGPDVLR